MAGTFEYPQSKSKLIGWSWQVTPKLQYLSYQASGNVCFLRDPLIFVSPKTFLRSFFSRGQFVVPSDVTSAPRRKQRTATSCPLQGLLDGKDCELPGVTGAIGHSLTIQVGTRIQEGKSWIVMACGMTWPLLPAKARYNVRSRIIATLDCILGWVFKTKGSLCRTHALPSSALSKVCNEK